MLKYYLSLNEQTRAWYIKKQNKLKEEFAVI